MSPKSLFFLFVVGLCATQMVSAHREARAVAGLFNAVTAKLTGYLTNAEGPIQAGINAVKQHINNLENMFLESGTNALQKAGIQVDLKALSTLVKGKIHGCANNDQIKGGAMEILNDMSSCVTKDVSNLKGLISKMDGLWETAKNMPQAIRNVAARCQSDEAVPEEPLKLTLDTSDHELAEASNEMLQAASKHVSKRALGGLLRLARCAKKVFDYAKGDLVNKIPGGVMGLSTGAYRIVQSVQGGIPACVAMKATENVGKITKLGLDVKSCVASGLTDASADNNPSLKALKQLANVAGVALKTLG